MMQHYRRISILGKGGGGASGIAGTFNAASFFLPLDPFLDGSVNTTPAIATGSPTATFTRAGATAWTRNRNGSWIGPIGANIARSYYSAAGVYLGYLAEGARTNHFLNSNAPVTQTSGSLGTGSYTLWMEGSGSVAVAQNTATITGAGTATAGNPVTFTVTVAGTVDYTVTGTPTIVQAENGAFASSYIQTAGASVTRNADVLTYASAGNILDALGSVYAEATTIWSTSVAISQLVGSPNNNILNVDVGADTRIGVNDGTVETTKAGLSSLSGGVRKRACAWGGSTMSVTGDGAAVASSAFDGTMTQGNANVGIGCNAGGGNPLYGTIRNVRIWTTQLSDSVLQTLTT